PLASEFGDYLNFFYVVLTLSDQGQITREEVESILGYDMENLCRHWLVREYIRDWDFGFKVLDDELNRLAKLRGWFVAGAANRRQPEKVFTAGEVTIHFR